MNSALIGTFKGTRLIVSKSVTADYTFDDSTEAVNVDATSGPVTITLPPISENEGRLVTVRKIDASANIVTIETDGSDLFQGSSGTTLEDQWSVVSIDNNGIQWHVTGGGSSGGGGSGGSGWLSITDISVTGGTASNKVYDDSPNNTILQSATISGLNTVVTIKASAPKVTVGATAAILSPHISGAFYTGTVAVTVGGSGSLTATLTTPDGAAGAFDTIMLTYAAPPVISALAFTGGYPGAQTELKAGDTFQVAGTTNVPAVGVIVSNFEAGITQSISFASTTSFTVTITIADRGTTLQALHARMAAVDANAAMGPTADTSNTVNLNNLYPTVTFGAKTYPGAQTALKSTETATVAVTTANLDSIVFDSPNGDLSVTAPTTIGSPKTVTRIGGTYNVVTNNLRAVATRAANAAQTTSQTVVNIANVAPTITVTSPAARLRSGGNNGTVAQNHTITITSNQQLSAAPTLDAGAEGTFLGSWSGGPTSYTRTLEVHDDDVKGTYTFTGLVATGLSGLVQNTIDSGSSYVLGGFVARDLTFAAFSQLTDLDVEVVTYSKLTASTFTATNGAASRNASQGNHSNLVDTFTVEALSTNPTSIYWNDATAAGTNSSGTAQILGVQETV